MEEGISLVSSVSWSLKTLHPLKKKNIDKLVLFFRHQNVL